MTVSREEAMFALASEKSGAERAAFLKIVCRADLALRQRVEALLTAHEAGENDTLPSARSQPFNLVWLIQQTKPLGSRLAVTSCARNWANGLRRGLCRRTDGAGPAPRGA